VSILSAPPVSPFKGLAAFGDSELDALFFFGREREREVIAANLLASRLTVLYGESGVGKSSLLAAAVVRDLRDAAPDAPIVLRTTWSGGVGDIGADFDDGAEGYLILDQFEEYFLYHADGGTGTLLAELPELLATTRVNVLIALREDNLARLDAFKARIPGVFANQLRLEHLDTEQARRAILGPLARWEELTGEHVDAEPSLVEAIVDDVAVDGGRVEAPYLQLVLERVWGAERDAGSWLLRRATLEELGGAAAIVRDQFRGALDALPPAEQDVAAAMFEHLVTPSGTKIAHDATDLAEYAGVEESTLRRVLSRLSRDRIVHSVAGSDRYEIFHDVLAEPVSSWRLQRRLERERAEARRRQRRLYVVVGLSLVALAVVAGLAIWAFSERGTAKRQARHAHARELQATSLQQLPIDPSKSVRLALAAARLESGQRTEDVLRQALIADRLVLVRREPAPISGVAASPSGDLVAVAVPHAGVDLRDAADGHLVRSLPARSVNEVGFSADGRVVIGASTNGVAMRWVAASGRRIEDVRAMVAARLPSGTFAVVPARHDLSRALHRAEHVVAAPGRRLVAASIVNPDGHKHVWVFDARGRRIRVLPQIGVHALAFSPDGRTLAVSTAPTFTYLWNTRTWKLAHGPLRDSKRGANAVAFSPDGKFLATGGADSGVRIWDVSDGERTFFLFAHTNPVVSLAWSPDSRVLASGSMDDTVRLWRIQTQVGSGSLAVTLPGHTESVTALAFTPDSTRLVSGSADRTLRWWLATPDEQLRLLGHAEGAALDAQWAGGTIAAAWSSGVVKTWDARTRERTHEFSSGGIGYTRLALSLDGSVLAAGRNDGRVDVWRADGTALAAGTLQAPVVAVALTAGGDRAAAADNQGRIVVWDTSSGNALWQESPQATVSSLAFSRPGDLLAVSGSDGTTLVAADDGRVARTLPAPGGDARASFSPNGRYVATAGLDHNGRIWSVRTGRLYRALKGHAAALNDIEFSGSGGLVVTASADADVRVWSVASGIGRAMERRAFGNVPEASLDATGRWVVAAAPISAIVWQAHTGRGLFYLRGHAPLLTSATFAPNRPVVLTASRDGTVRTYDCVVCVDLHALVALAEQRLAAAG
jgi:WD40 repeat protein